MNNGGFTLSAAAFHAPKDFQMAKALLPSQEVQQAIGRGSPTFRATGTSPQAHLQTLG